MSTPLEITVERYLVRQVKDRCGWQVKGENTPGFPDRIVFAPGGKVAFVETKTVDGVLSKIQVRVHQILRALGSRVDVLWTKEMVDVFAREFFSP